MKSAMDILKEDFEDAFSKIDFSAEYDPYSREFMKPLFIGMLLVALKTVNEEGDVKEELDGAEKYWDMYSESGDVVYRDMASDELRHAGILIKKHLAKASDEKTKAKLNGYEKERQELLKAVNAAKGE